MAARAATDAPAAFKCPVASLLKTVTDANNSVCVQHRPNVRERARDWSERQKEKEREREREQETRETQGERQRPARVQGCALRGGRRARGAAAVVVRGGESWALLGAMPGGEREGE